MKFTEVLEAMVDSGPILSYSYDGTRLYYETEDEYYCINKEGKEECKDLDLIVKILDAWL